SQAGFSSGLELFTKLNTCMSQKKAPAHLCATGAQLAKWTIDHQAAGFCWENTGKPATSLPGINKL
ncbi:MAG: hypothetical protein AAFR36_32420, partial [Bacteroidota bacterium]